MRLDTAALAASASRLYGAGMAEVRQSTALLKRGRGAISHSSAPFARRSITCDLVGGNGRSIDSPLDSPHSCIRHKRQSSRDARRRLPRITASRRVSAIANGAQRSSTGVIPRHSRDPQHHCTMKGWRRASCTVSRRAGSSVNARHRKSLNLATSVDAVSRLR
jgi:hypothetical protein